MTAGDHLGQQFFHASTADLQPGDTVHPGHAVGVNNFPNLRSWRNQSVWLSDNEHDAWKWTHVAGDYGARKTVYQVEPSESPLKRRKLDTVGGAEYTAPQAKVTHRFDIPPIGHRGLGHPEIGPNDEVMKDSGVQGTLPGADWPNVKRATDRETIQRNWARIGAETAHDADQKTRHEADKEAMKKMPRLSGI